MIGHRVFFDTLGGGGFGKRCKHHEPCFGHIDRQSYRDAAEFRGFREGVSGFFKTGFGARYASITTANAGALAIPQPNVAIGMGLRTFATEVFHQTAEVGRLERAGFEFVKLIAGATMMHQMVGIRARALEGIQTLCVQHTGSKGGECFNYPVRMRGTSGNIDYRQSVAIPVITTQQAARSISLELQPACISRIATG